MILDKIVADKKLRLPLHKSIISERKMRALAQEAIHERPQHPSSEEALAKPGSSIIGEIKNAAPSWANIESNLDLAERIAEYDAWSAH